MTRIPRVTLAHGGGGKAMKDLIRDVFVEAFDNPLLRPLEDQARFDLAELSAHGDRLTANHGREGGQALLAIQQKPRAVVGVDLLRHGEFL